MEFCCRDDFGELLHVDWLDVEDVCESRERGRQGWNGEISSYQLRGYIDAAVV